MSVSNYCDTEVSGSQSILSFATTGGGSWPVWDRFLQIDGKPAYHIGNICGTCAYFFERLEGAVEIDNSAYSIQKLNAGISAIDEDLLRNTKAIMPDGNYLVILHELLPVMTKPHDELDYFSLEQVKTWHSDGGHDPKTSYYRLQSAHPTPDERFFEFLVPMFPAENLNDERVEFYRQSIRNAAKPTLLTLGVLDRKGISEEDEEGVWSHVCLSHFIIDGHHKAYAASLEGLPITALSFIALGQGVSTPADARRFALDFCRF